MSRRLIILLLVMGALWSLGMKVFPSSAEPTPVKFTAVTRQDVHQVKAISGILTYADEQYILAPASGVVSKVCVQVGQRVTGNDALIRMDIPSQASDIAELLQEKMTAFSLDSIDLLAQQRLPSNQTIRSQADRTVRQVLVKEGAFASLGSPLLRLSSNEQLIRCRVMPMDGQDLHPGQWGWISSNGEPLGTAAVVEVGNEEINAMTGLREKTIILSPMMHINFAEGAAIDVEIFLAGSDHVLALPVEAITERNTVWWVNQGRCTEIPAEIVLSDELYAWVNLPEGLLVAIGEFKEGQLVEEEN